MMHVDHDGRASHEQGSADYVCQIMVMQARHAGCDKSLSAIQSYTIRAPKMTVQKNVLGNSSKFCNALHDWKSYFQICVFHVI